MCRSVGLSVNLFFVLLGLLVSISVVVYALFYAQATDEGSLADPRGSRAAETLKLLVVISRHGSRRSLSSLPNDTVHWKYGLGELTSIGRLQAYNLGGKIRQLYNGFLNTLYQSGDVLASSTSVDRTLMSGELFLAGLYPPTGYQVWDNLLNWQPIPLYSNSPDKSMWVTHLCPRYSQDEAASLKAFERDNAYSVNPTNSYLSDHLGYNVTGVKALYAVWDALYCEDVEGLPLPEWAKPVYPQTMGDIIDRAMIAKSAGTATMIRLIIGPLFQEIISAMAMKVNGSLTPDRQLYYYSGHDTTVVPLQAMLGIPAASITGMVWPGSALIFELHQHAGGMFSVQVLYVDGSSLSKEPRAIEIPACGNPCDLATIINITQKYTNITNYNQECQINN